MSGLLAGSFRLVRRIGSGSFGQIYSAEDTKTLRRVAVKLEPLQSRVPQLHSESKIYRILQGGTGIPRLFWSGSDERHNYIVIDLLGQSLEDLFVKCHSRLTLKTVLMLADQMLTCVEFVHRKSLIHRDIKPDNFVMGVGARANQVFIIDYGLAKKYRDQRTHRHIPYIEGKALTGTARYASVGALRGAEQSRRDDLEALGYVWLYLLRGSLPWMGLKFGSAKHKYDRICEVKSGTSFEALCRGFPIEFVRYFQAVRSLHFTDAPDYARLRAIFRDLFVRLGFVYDYRYDWAPSGAPTQTRRLSPQLVARRAAAEPQQQPALATRQKENRGTPYRPQRKEAMRRKHTQQRKTANGVSTRRARIPSWMASQVRGRVRPCVD